MNETTTSVIVSLHNNQHEKLSLHERWIGDSVIIPQKCGSPTKGIAMCPLKVYHPPKWESPSTINEYDKI